MLLRYTMTIQASLFYSNVGYCTLKVNQIQLQIKKQGSMESSVISNENRKHTSL